MRVVPSQVLLDANDMIGKAQYHAATILLLENCVERKTTGSKYVTCGTLLEAVYKRLNEDHYQALRSKSSDNEAQLKKNYLKLCLLYHPDKNRVDTSELFQCISRAYAVLSAASNRRKFDQKYAENKERYHSVISVSPSGVVKDLKKPIVKKKWKPKPKTPLMPFKFKCDILDETSATFTWECKEKRRPLFFEVKFRQIKEKKWLAVNKKHTELNVAQKMNLNPRTTYEFKVRASCEGAESDYCTPINIYTKAPTSEEKRLQSSRKSSSWREPKDNVSQRYRSITISERKPTLPRSSSVSSSISRSSSMPTSSRKNKSSSKPEKQKKKGTVRSKAADKTDWCCIQCTEMNDYTKQSCRGCGSSKKLSMSLGERLSAYNLGSSSSDEDKPPIPTEYNSSAQRSQLELKKRKEEDRLNKAHITGGTPGGSGGGNSLKSNSAKNDKYERNQGWSTWFSDQTPSERDKGWFSEDTPGDVHDPVNLRAALAEVLPVATPCASIPYTTNATVEATVHIHQAAEEPQYYTQPVNFNSHETIPGSTSQDPPRTSPTKIRWSKLRSAVSIMSRKRGK